ncbi:MAG: hypothetical protein ACRCUS_10630, partial [Anaerovoracaceae bacterium]
MKMATQKRRNKQVGVSAKKESSEERKKKLKEVVENKAVISKTEEKKKEKKAATEPKVGKVVTKSKGEKDDKTKIRNNEKNKEVKGAQLLKTEEEKEI